MLKHPLNLLLVQPERISGHEYTIRSDVWSMGITLLELVMNRFPFPADLPAIELMMYITASEVRLSSFTLAFCVPHSRRRSLLGSRTRMGSSGATT